MDSVRVVLIGGTSSVGKSTVGRLVRDRLCFEYGSTDALAKHPGRPWRTSGHDVPRHVAEHYQSLPVDELVTSVLGHYKRSWPRIEEVITRHAAADNPRAGLVLESSSRLPLKRRRGRRARNRLASYPQHGRAE